VSVLEREVEIAREDGVLIPALELVPDLDEAIVGTGVLVVATEREVVLRFARQLCEAGYFVVGLAPDCADHAHAIEDLEAGLLRLRGPARKKLGVLAFGIAGAIAIEAATKLPQIDCVVHGGGPPPGDHAKLARLRAAIIVHRAATSALFSKDDFDNLAARAAPARVFTQDCAYPCADGFFAHPRDDHEALQSRIAFDRTRDAFAPG
jgi:hypothetical protein